MAPGGSAARTRGCAVICAAVAVVVCSAAPAEAFIYFDNGAAIGRANLDGTGLRRAFAPTASSVRGAAVAVDAAHIYWTNGAGRIARANIDGSKPEPAFIAGVGSTVVNIAVDAAHVYWTDEAGRVGRANLDGSNSEPAFIVSGPTAVVGLAVDTGHIYFANAAQFGGTITRANLDATNPQPNFAGASAVGGIAVDARHLYWANQGFFGGTGLSIGRANLDGTAPDRTFIKTVDLPRGIAVDGRHLYWSTGGAIARANLDGTRSVENFIPNVRSQWVAVDALGPAGSGGGTTPALGRTAAVRVVTGVVRYKARGSKSFVKLTGSKTIPVGSIVDAGQGTVALTSAVDTAGATQTANFSSGQFRLGQSTTGALTTLTLTGGNFAACGSGATVRAAAIVARASAGGKSKRVIRQLRGQGKGKFRTKGRYSAATVRGTTWVTQDRCDGTLVKVIQGSVSVRVTRTKKTIVVSAGNSFLAKAG
jgi:hypothetical protein